ncbi:hypothetical protein DPEC_G00081730 [Dallia pectoralis]|uniref:Uncharacterized protein n=1 Tax=Dallia pectoralis TaxID=75939 RepID=A0ACC2GZ21_DALPE|nr:hypothetical protein DPEC_G00081730 [Dallia pectoralis]
MSTKEMFQAQLSHIMGLLVESAVMEMGRLFDGCAAVLEGHENTVLKSEMERVNSINMMKFASFMEVLSKSLMENILLMTVNEAEVTVDEPAVAVDEPAVAVDKAEVIVAEAEEAMVDKAFADSVISVKSEFNSCVVMIDPQDQDISDAVWTQKGTMTDKLSASECDNQEEDSDPRDVEWLPDDDPSQKASIKLHSLSSTRLKTHRSLSDPDKQDTSACGTPGAFLCQHVERDGGHVL